MQRCFILLLVLIFGCQQEFPPSATALTDAEIAQIESEVEAKFASLIELLDGKDFDPEKFVDHFSNLRTDGLHLYGKTIYEDDKLKEAIRSWDGTSWQEFSDREVEVVVLTPSVALVTAVFSEIRSYTSSDTLRESSAWLNVYVKENNEWKLHSDQDARWPIENNASGQ